MSRPPVSKATAFARASLVALGLIATTASYAADDLLKVYQQALENDPTLAAAASNRSATSEGLGQAEAGKRPQITASGNLSTAASSANTNSHGSRSYSLQLSQALYNAQTDANIQIAQTQIKQSDAQYTAAEQDLIVRVAQAYFDQLGAQDNLEFAEADKKAIARQLEQAQKRYEVGLIAITDVHEAQARYDLAVAEEIAAQTAVDNSQEALQIITGELHQQLQALGETTPLEPPKPAKLGDWAKQADTNNPSLIAARDAAQLAFDNIALSDAGDAPSVNLVGTHSWAKTVGGASAGNRSDNSIALQLSLPLSTGGRIDAATRQARHLHQAALDQLEQTRRSTKQQTRNAYRNMISGISRVKALEQAVRSNKSALQATEAGFEVGTRTVVDVLNAQRGLFGAIRDLKRARYDYLLARLQLKQAAGSVTQDDIQTINSYLD